ncbi:MAG TPA: phosphatase PAP2 family protein [Bacteroidia bacterium]|nr:phosphatase PAP2 family protein [Bacteroidia bacterium]
MAKKLIFSFLLIFSLETFPAQNADLRILKSINQHDHPIWDESMRVTSDGVYPFMVISPAALWLTGYLNKDETMKRNGVKTVIAIGVNIAITEGLKESIKRPRPFTSYPDDINLRTKASGFSFPSGHTSCAFATATALTLSTKKWYVGVPAFAYAGLVGYSRMRLGAHYGSDVLAGILVGVGSSLLTWQCDKWINKK